MCVVNVLTHCWRQKYVCNECVDEVLETVCV